MTLPENPQYRDRMNRLEKWRALGVDPYGQRVDGLVPIETARALHKGAEITPHDGGETAKVAGRIVLLRDIGKLIFITIRDSSGSIQIGLAKQNFVAPHPEAWPQAKLLELGDIAWFEGKVGHTKTGEVTIWANGFGLSSKALLPPPDKFHGLSDTETRFRQRYVDLAANPDSLDVFLFRSRMIESIRAFLKARQFVEVETPMMQSLAGGAAARPFSTHHNALDIDLYLRISPELYLKRLMVGGMERVFEINRNFRNEGIDTTHNPEFTMMEAYQAYSDLAGMMELTESLFVRLATERRAAIQALSPNPASGASALSTQHSALHLPYGDRILDFTPPFERISYAALFKEHVGIEMTDAAAVARVAAERGIDVQTREHDVIVGELFERHAEPTLQMHDRPVFVYDYPAALCPLTRRKPGDPRIAERFELYVAGMELANAYTELNDPVIQEETFSRQLAGQKAEDSMARVDDDFVTALRYGMPPAGGLGIGIDRLAMVMTNRQSIRDVVLFPLLKPTQSVVELDEARVEADVELVEAAKAEAIKANKIPVFFAHDKDGNLRIVEI